MRCALIVPGVLLPTLALAQDAGLEDIAQANPQTVVQAARGDAVTVLSEGRRHRAARPFERELRLPVVRHRCYELIGHAVGDAPAFAEVRVGRAPVGEALALTNAVGRVARLPFCATQLPELYALAVRAEGPSSWYVTVVERGGDGLSPRPATAPQDPAGTTAATAPAEPRPTLPQHPVGGAEGDYVARQIREFARQRPGVTGLTAVTRSPLPTNGVLEGSVAIPSGRCVDVVAVGVPSVADLVVEVEDPAGQRVAQDAARRAVESVRYCAPFAGSYRVRVRVFSGAGLVGVQTLLEP